MKRLLTVDEAAEYCGLGTDSFRTNCPVAPKRVRPGMRGLRFDVQQLDEWIDNLKADGQVTKTPSTPDEWLEKLGESKNSRREDLREQRDNVRVPPGDGGKIVRVRRDGGFFI